MLSNGIHRVVYDVFNFAGGLLECTGNADAPFIMAGSFGLLSVILFCVAVHLKKREITELCELDEKNVEKTSD